MNETTTASFGNILNPFRQNGSPTATILTLFFVAFTTLYAFQTSHTYLRLRHIPGPLLNGFTPLVITYHCLRGDINTYNQRLVNKYGPLVRVTPTTVMISDAKTLAYVCSTKAGYRKGLYFEFARWSLERRSRLSMRGNEERKERKGKLGPAVSFLFFIFLSCWVWFGGDGLGTGLANSIVHRTWPRANGAESRQDDSGVCTVGREEVLVDADGGEADGVWS
jgi:hypothetical protein